MGGIIGQEQEDEQRLTWSMTTTGQIILGVMVGLQYIPVLSFRSWEGFEKFLQGVQDTAVKFKPRVMVEVDKLLEEAEQRQSTNTNAPSVKDEPNNLPDEFGLQGRLIL